MNLYFYSYFDPDSYLDPGVSDCESLVTILRLLTLLAKICPRNPAPPDYGPQVV